MTTRRLSARPSRLLLDALGSPREVIGKSARLASGLAGYARGAELDRRLAKLASKGLIDRIPSRIQIAVGGYDMLRFWIAPAADEYYGERGIGFAFHQLLRFFEEPASLIDPVGFFSTEEGIVGHLMQVVHANPLYDLELLQMFDDGLEVLECEIESMIAGTHPRAVSIGAIVEEPDYHHRLLDFVRAFRVDPNAVPPLRSNVSGSERWSDIERTFGSLRTSMRYFCRMPTDVLGAIRHLSTVDTFPSDLAEPQPTDES